MAHAIPFDEREAINGEPRECGGILEATNRALSLIVTDTLPGDGPPIHTHTSEE